MRFPLLSNILFTSEKFNKDVLWNIISLIVSGSCGLIVTYLIAKNYDAKTLGLFNISFVLYNLFAQLFSFGIHFSVLKFVAEFIENLEIVKIILTSALIVVFVTSIVLSFIVFILRYLIGEVFSSVLLPEALAYLLPGIFFFSINKVFFGFYNGRRSMRLFSVMFSLKFIVMLVTVWVIIQWNFPGVRSTLAFSVAEGFIFFVFFVLNIKNFKFDLSTHKDWLIRHLNYGMRVAGGNLLVDVNTRIDVMILGIITNEKTVGLYSLPITIIEGFNQFTTAIRNNVNPIITNYFIAGRIQELRQKLLKGRNLLYIFGVPLTLFTIVLYPFVLSLLGLTGEYGLSYLPYIILVIGFAISWGYQPYTMIFNQTGYPHFQSFYYLLVFSTNLILNLILISQFDLIGAAIATGLSYISWVFYLKLLLYKKQILKI
ncbi:MAG: oligosaccharide flippase family protein [Ignavibacteria bacterium]